VVGCQEAIATAMANSKMWCRQERIGADGNVRIGRWCD